MSNREVMQQALEALESGLAFDTHSDVLQNLRTALEQQAEPVQERITHITWDERGVRTVNGIPDDAPQRQWQGLTDDEITELDMEISGRTMDECVRAIEAKLKERNT